MALSKKKTRRVSPRLRVYAGEEIALGPGKVELLELVDATGSIKEAATRLDMSYMRAWTLIRTMNQCFKNPLVTTARGGKYQGGTSLTPTGREALRLYRLMETEAVTAAQKHWGALESLMEA